MSSVASIFLYCFFGKLATESYLAMADSLYETNWFKLSNSMQKMFLLMIEQSQRPIYYHGFGLVIMNLETFTKVRNFRCVETLTRKFISWIFLFYFNNLQYVKSIISYCTIFRTVASKWITKKKLRRMKLHESDEMNLLHQMSLIYQDVEKN